nr:AAA family ATPase [Actinomycetota bacterium]
VLLQLLDDGRLTDGHGRTVNFSNVVLIMTSNLPGDPAAFFRPEFLNRIDEIVRFRSLSEADIGRIVHIQVRHLATRLAARRLSLDVSDDAAAWLARAGYDPTYGARPLKRVIQRKIADPLALALLEGRYSEGDTVHVDVAGDELVLK